MFEEINAHRQAVRENIKKAFEIGFTGNDIEKAKQWQVGDEATDKHGVTYYVHALNAAGKPLWRKKKDSGANANNSSSTGRGNNSTKSSSSKQAVDVVLTNEDYDRVFHNVGLSRQTFFEHNNKPYILKIFGKRFDGSYIISVHNGETEKRLQGDSNIAISVKRAFINQLKQEKLRDIERNAKKKQASESKEETKNLQKPIVPNAALQYGNLPSRQFDQLYKDFDSQFKSYTKEQLSQAIDKIGDSVSKQISLYKRMKANGDSKIALNKQGNFIDQLSARVYTLKRLLNEKEKQAKSTDDTQKNSAVDAKVKPSSKKNPSELETISEVEDYAKSISGVTFKSVKSGWGDKGAKAFELTYPHGGKLVIDFLNNEEYVYELTDSNDKSIISTNSTNETSHTDWSIRLNPDKLVSQRVEVLKTKLTKLKGEETKARNKMTRNYSSFSDKYAYQKASEAVSDMKTKIQKLQSLIGTF